MNFAAWLTQTVNVAPVSGIDQYGKPTYGPPVARQVRLEQRRTMVTTGRGEEAVANHRLWCAEPINLTDRIWLPGLSTADNEAAKLALTVSSSSDKPGARTLYKVEF